MAKLYEKRVDLKVELFNLVQVFNIFNQYVNMEGMWVINPLALFSNDILDK